MAPEEFDAIEALAKAATPGPWTAVRDGVRCRDARMPGQSFRLLTLSSFEMSQSDLAFVAAARTDVPELVAEVRRLKANAVENHRALLARILALAEEVRGLA